MCVHVLFSLTKSKPTMQRTEFKDPAAIKTDGMPLCAPRPVSCSSTSNGTVTAGDTSDTMNPTINAHARLSDGKSQTHTPVR